MMLRASLPVLISMARSSGISTLNSSSKERTNSTVSRLSRPRSEENSASRVTFDASTSRKFLIQSSRRGSISSLGRKCPPPPDPNFLVRTAMTNRCGVAPLHAREPLRRTRSDWKRDIVAANFSRPKTYCEHKISFRPWLARSALSWCLGRRMALTGFILVLSTVEMTVHPSLCLTYKKKPHWVKPWDRPGGFGRQRTREAQKLRFFMEFQRQCKKSTAQIARIESRQERNRSATHPRLNSTKSSHHRRNSTSSRPFNATSSTDAPKSPKKPRRLPTRIGATTNHYAVLEIPFNASDQDVSRAFRRMSVRYHPDKLRRAGQERINATDAKAKFLSIKTAFDVLSSSKRHKYNHELADAITRVYLYSKRIRSTYGANLVYLERVAMGTRKIRRGKKRRRKVHQEEGGKEGLKLE
ncbi:hypothetical protein AAMO2058_001161000 [Amorphochlora amoebiformis]